MRGGLERWKRGVNSRGVRQAISYALEGTCDAHLQHSPGVDALAAYSAAPGSTVSRFIIENGVITSDELTAGSLRVWLTGHDPVTGEERGHQRLSPDADLLLDGTLNHPKSYSIAALLHPELALAIEQGVGLAFVGDTHQALPVGHAGAMGSAIRHANAAVELDTVHRFRDPDYAALTLRLRDAGDRERALVVAGELAEQGHVDRVDHHDAARERMIDAYFQWHARGKRVTLVSSTNAEADAINDVIQQRRVDRGELDARVAAWGMGQQRILVGDTVQTRRNDRLTRVENRAQWIVRGIRDEYVSLVAVGDSGEVGRVSSDYAREHLQLAYASTVHGVQGDTADASVVGPDVDAQGCTWALRAGGCTTSRSSSRGRMPRPASASRSRCSAALRS